MEDSRLVYVDLSQLDKYSDQSPEISAGEIAVKLARIYAMEVVLAFNINQKSYGKEFEFIIDNDDMGIFDTFDKLDEEGVDYIDAVREILKDNDELMAVIVKSGDEIGVAFLYI